MTIHNLTTRPTASTTSRKEYKVQDYLGTTRLVVEPDGMGGGAITGRYDHAPYGDILWSSALEKRLSWIDKEKDEESGDHNFGVRQYDDGIGRFMAIDPLWEKYRSLSPYHYGANNPLIYTDPSGMVIEFAEGTSEEFKQGYQEAIAYLRQSETASAIIDYLEGSDQVFIIGEGEIGSTQYANDRIDWNTQEGITVVDNNGDPVKAYDKDGRSVRPAQSPAMGLIHEMSHAYNDAVDPEGYDNRRSRENSLPHWTNKEEKKVIKEVENKVARELNEKMGRKQEVERPNHDLKTYKTKGSTTTTLAD